MTCSPNESCSRLLGVLKNLKNPGLGLILEKKELTAQLLPGYASACAEIDKSFRVSDSTVGFHLARIGSVLMKAADDIPLVGDKGASPLLYPTLARGVAMNIEEALLASKLKRATVKLARQRTSLLLQTCSDAQAAEYLVKAFTDLGLTIKSPKQKQAQSRIALPWSVAELLKASIAGINKTIEEQGLL